MEEFAFILDNLRQGRTSDRTFNRSPLVLGVGESEFKLLEMIPKDEAIITVGDRVYIGKDLAKRDKIMTVKRRIGYDELTSSAITELPFILESIIKSQEATFINFFNKADSINSRMHTLELLQGLGNKTMWAIIDERKKQPFSSFKDLTDRVKTVHHPEKMIALRIVEEISGKNDKYRIFVRQ